MPRALLARLARLGRATATRELPSMTTRFRDMSELRPGDIFVPLRDSRRR